MRLATTRSRTRDERSVMAVRRRRWGERRLRGSHDTHGAFTPTLVRDQLEAVAAAGKCPSVQLRLRHHLKQINEFSKLWIARIDWRNQCAIRGRIHSQHTFEFCVITLDADPKPSHLEHSKSCFGQKSCNILQSNLTGPSHFAPAQGPNPNRA